MKIVQVNFQNESCSGKKLWQKDENLQTFFGNCTSADFQIRSMFWNKQKHKQ